MSNAKNCNSVYKFIFSKIADLVLEYQITQNTAKGKISRGTISILKEEHGRNFSKTCPRTIKVYE